MSTDTNNPDWETIGFVLASDYRSGVIKALQGAPAMPSELAEETGIPMPHVSRSLSNFLERDIVEILNPSARKGRLYRLTEHGDAIVGNLDRGDRA